ncbi:MAG: hypothetical protein JNN12_11020 [Bacteroidetes Order II. Incertae sedis bacterium]|nr:hypothetical protein [Bacteroidetes Order II. bacterium]
MKSKTLCETFFQTPALWLLFLLPAVLPAQPLTAPVRSLGVGGAGVALVGETSGLLNPAALGESALRQVSFSAAQGFGMAELRHGLLTVSLPMNALSLGLNVGSFGFEAFRETQFRLHAARGFGFGSKRKFYLGATAQYHMLNISNYGNGSAFSVGIGGLTALTDRTMIGFRISNLNKATYTNGEELPRNLAVGLAYKPLPDVRFLLDAEKDVRFPVSVRGGFEYSPVKSLTLRSGFSTAPVRYAAGVGFKAGRLGADAAFERHETLGWTPSVAFSVGF